MTDRILRGWPDLLPVEEGIGSPMSQGDICVTTGVDGDTVTEGLLDCTIELLKLFTAGSCPLLLTTVFPDPTLTASGKISSLGEPGLSTSGEGASTLGGTGAFFCWKDGDLGELGVTGVVACCI